MILAQAPMMNQSDSPFRRLLYTCFAPLSGNERCTLVTYTQMIRLGELGHPPTFAQLAELSHPKESLILQVGIATLEEAMEMVALLQNYLDAPEYSHITGIDLNCGCPQPVSYGLTLGRRGRRNWRLSYPPRRRAHRCCNPRSLAEATPSTAQALGQDPDRAMPGRHPQDSEVLSLSHRSRLIPYVDLIAVHGRTLEQGRSGEADLAAVAAVAAHVQSRATVLSNGNVIDGWTGVSALQETQAGGLMSGEPLLVVPPNYLGLSRPSQ